VWAGRGKVGGFEPPHFKRLKWGGTAPLPASTGRIARRLFRACYGPVTSLLSANYLPVMVLFRALRRFSVNHRKTNGFLRILKAGIASEQGEKGA
jgi:hypothetical protein